jgi:hypothetical protein
MSVTTNSGKLGLDQPNQTSVRVRVPYIRHDELSGKLLLAEDDGRIVSPNTKIREKKTVSRHRSKEGSLVN